ncbi:UbiA prenyltransferase family-domain-containing protein [Polychytrium aggregatum]|uniref:UbiA prenyltransferase family-domain-containing protein n=1 Tax=Polychytrium aggregatum TaxID=110093 RepID=UPI0022FEB48B|nr:UbiA prenyltransferase family-domain-containing protein [Polychytrium aggregatum]KAI9205510.1 UbiA prenyltransferase family-domain-containing protein [Polychytrium aggregatum]
MLIRCNLLRPQAVEGVAWPALKRYVSVMHLASVSSRPFVRHPPHILGRLVPIPPTGQRIALLGLSTHARQLMQKPSSPQVNGPVVTDAIAKPNPGPVLEHKSDPDTEALASSPTNGQTAPKINDHIARPEDGPDSKDNSAPHELRWKDAPAFQFGVYQELSKAQLAALVVLTTMAGYAMAPGATDVATLLWTTVGTTLCVTSANSINQWIEAPYDAQMARTRTRPLVRHALSPGHAFTAGITSGIAGVGLLTYFVNPITAVLGGFNILLYTCVYTPLKRTSISNTWAGAVVGAIPPMMGWTACTSTLDPGAWILGAFLYAWQFPHFNALSWNLRPDYSKAGYRMASVVDPALNARVALRYSLLLFPLSLAVPYIGLTTPWFIVTSSVVNGILLAGAIQFWRKSTDKSARQLFFGSLIHLPVILALMMVHKKRPDDDEEKEEKREETTAAESG